MKIINLNENTRKELLLQLQKRSPSSYGGYEKTVNEIIENVRQHGDKALFDYTEKFDHCSLSPGKRLKRPIQRSALNL